MKPSKTADQALELFFKVKKTDVFLYQFIFEGYDNVGLVSAYKNGEIIRILTTHDQKETALCIMESLKKEVEFETVDDETAKKVQEWFRLKEREYQ